MRARCASALVPACPQHEIILASRLNEGCHREASRLVRAGGRVRKALATGVPSAWPVGSLAGAATETWDTAQGVLRRTTFTRQSQASGALLPRFFELTSAERERQEETARVRVDGRRDLSVARLRHDLVARLRHDAPGSRSRAECAGCQTAGWMPLLVATRPPARQPDLNLSAY